MKIPFWSRRTPKRDPDLDHAAERLDHIEQRAFAATTRVVERGGRNHFTEMWQQIINEPGGTHG